MKTARQILYPSRMRQALSLGATRQEIAAVLRYVSLRGKHHSVESGTGILKEDSP